MLIKLKDDYFIRSDSYQYILSVERIKDTGENIGEKYYRDIGFYPKIDQLLDDYSDKIIRAASVTSFRELKEVLYEIRTELIEVNKQLA